MTTPATILSVDELVAIYAAEAMRSGPAPPLVALVTRLRDAGSDADFWARVGDALSGNGFAEAAAALLAAGLQQHPRQAQLHYLRGNALRVSQRHAEAETDFRAALRLSPGHRQAALSLAFMRRELGRIEAAGDAILAQWRAEHGNAEQSLELLEFLRESGAQKQARALAAAAQARWPQHARIAAIAGELALAFGDFADARTLLRRAVQVDPAQSSAWLRLSYCQRCSDPDDADLALLRDAWTRRETVPASRICAGFGVGKLLDDLDDRAGAAAVLRKANALADAQSSWSADAWQALTERQIAHAPLPALDIDSTFVPVFIVGLPRSGTTLVATRLARHADVHDRGELNWIAAMYEHLSAQDALRDRSALQSIRNLIATQMRRDDAAARFYIDKNPLNYRHLNLALALFPNARIVHLQRDARDTALSLWSQHFAHPDLGFSYDFSSIAATMRGHERLMAHWRTALRAQILEVEYETLATDPTAQLARIAAYIGLRDTAAADAPHADIITTASVWQARQPVYASAIGRWRRYAEFVPELTDMFEDTGLRAEG